MQITIMQIIMIITGITSFTMVVGSGLAMYSGKEGLSNRTRKALILLLLACVLFWPLAGQACDDEEVTLKTHYPTYGGWNRR